MSLSEREQLLKEELGTNVFKRTGVYGRSCNSEFCTFETDAGKVFVKFNGECGAMQMYEGEFASLRAIQATGTVLIPKPIKSVYTKSYQFLIIDEMSTKRLHLHNSKMKIKSVRLEQSVHENQNPEIYDFFARKIDQHVRLAEKQYGEREASEAWSTFYPSLPKLFSGLAIEPALLHGDLWSGNAGETDSEPEIFDPASMYGHAEYDLGIATMYGDLGPRFFNAYHRLLPRHEGFEDRIQLYCFFHYFNHWNHFGGGYKRPTLNILQGLIKKYF